MKNVTIMPKSVTLFLTLLAVWVGALLLAGDAEAQSELKLPRFVSIKSSEVNVRTGPGLRYQIKWVIKRDELPVEVIAEFEQWRKIRDIDGDEGWTHSAMLSGKRTVLIKGGEQILREKPEANAFPVAKLEKGALAEVLECNATYCKVKANEYRGWLERAQLWGIYPGEEIK